MESRDKLNLGIVIANFEREYSSSDFLAHGETSECLDSYGAVLGYLAKKGSAMSAGNLEPFLLEEPG